jgi:hypothetical protein
MDLMKKVLTRDPRHRLSLAEASAPQSSDVTIPRPDFLKRLKRAYKGKRLKVSGAELLSAERDRF